MKTLVQMVEAFRIHEPRYVLPNMFTADLSTMVNPMSALSRGGRKAFLVWAEYQTADDRFGEYYEVHGIKRPWGHLTETQKLKQALTEALEEMTEVRIRDVAHSIGIGHIGSNDVRVMAENLLRSHPDYRFVIMSDHKGQVTRAFENGVLTCCEYEEG